LALVEICIFVFLTFFLRSTSRKRKAQKSEQEK
jgi:hypothetical protein